MVKSNNLSVAVAAILIVGGVASLSAATYKGTVISVSGDVAKVAMEGDVMPPNGARARSRAGSNKRGGLHPPQCDLSLGE